jgi:hypothetical protein
MILILLVLTMLSPIYFVLGIMHLIDRLRYGKNNVQGGFIKDVLHSYFWISLAILALLLL